MKQKLLKYLLPFLLSFARCTPSPGQTAPATYYQFNGNLNQTVGTTPLATGGVYAINSGGPVGQYLSLSSASSNYLDGQSNSPPTGFCVQLLFRATYNFTNIRNTQLFIWGNQYVFFEYPKIIFGTQNSSSPNPDQFDITMDGQGRKTWSYISDGNWHHFAFNYNSSTGRKEVWVDGQLPTGFFKTTNTGSIAISGSQIMRLNGGVLYNKIYGDIDELAIYNAYLQDKQIYQNYLDYISGNHYTTALAASVPAAASVTGTYSSTDFAPGSVIPSIAAVTTGVTVSPLTQLQTFPIPRYKPNHTLHPIFNGGAPEYEGQRFQAGVTDAQALINDTSIQKEFCKNWNFMISIKGNFQPAEQTFSNDPANLIYKNSTVLLRIQTNPIVRSQTLANDKYVQNSSGTLTNQQGGAVGTGFKYWRPTTVESFYNGDGNTAKSIIGSILTSQTNRPANRKLDLIWEDGEELYTFTNKGLWTDPRIRDSVTAFGGNYQNWYAWRFMRVETLPYRDIVYSGVTGLTNCLYAYYALDGYNRNNDQEGTDINSTTLPERFVWSYARQINTPIGTKYYATPDFYLYKPSNWYIKSAYVNVDGHGQLAHGWNYMTYTRAGETAVGDDIYSPFVHCGSFAQEEVNPRPAQWLGILKPIAVSGAEWYYSNFFNLGTPWANATNWIWMIPIPSYVQALTSRWEPLLRHSFVMTGDVPSDYTNPSVLGYSFYAGDMQKLVVIRKDSTTNKYVIGANINPITSTQSNVPDSGLATITLAGTQMKFYVRRQGSMYYFDNTVSPPVFYQMDGWHENTHPYYWTADFNLEAELADTASAGMVKKTFRTGGPATGDYSSFTTQVNSAAANDSMQFRVQPRTAATYYLYVRAKSTDATTTGMTLRMDFASSTVINCITDTNWTWYRYVTGTSTAVSYSLTAVSHTFSLIATAGKLSIDKLVLSTNASLVASPNVPCGAVTATITPSGSTTFCQGGSVTLTANSASAYSWSTGATTQAISVAVSGTYTVTVTISASTASTSATVTVLPLPTATVTPSGATTFCSGGSVNLTASVNSSYAWSTGSTAQTISVATSGTYTVTVTGANGCTKSSSPVTVTVTSGPSAVITAGGSASFCPGGSVTLSVTTGSGYAYQWKRNTVAISGATASTYVATVAGDYTETTTVSSCSTTSNTITVTLLTSPTTTIASSGATTFCSGGSVTLTASANTSYQWSTGASTQAISVSSTGNYTVTVTGANGCTAVSSATSVTVNPNPTATISAGGSTTICTGSTVSLIAVTGVGYTYQWKRTAVNIAGATNSTYTASVAGAYTVVTTLSSCTALSNTLTVTVVAATTTANAGPDQSVCTDSTTLQGNTPASGSGLWTLVSGTGTITTTSSPTTAVTALGVGANVFQWSITNAPCASSSDPVTITRTGASPVSITITGTPNPFCSGATINYTALPVNGGTPTYQWKKNGVNVGSNIPTYSAAGVNGDLITCVLTSSLGCATGSPATSNTITATLSSVTAAITAGGATTFCSGSSVLLSANTGSGLTYQWKNSGGNISGQTNAAYTASTSETYTCVVTNSNSCSATSNSIVVTVNSLPTATITPSGATTFCSGSNVVLTASSNTSYLWSTGVVTQNITVSSSGTFTVTVTNSSGCTAVSSSTTVTVNTQPTATLTPSTDTSFCSGSSCTFSTPTVTGATYQWYNTGVVIPSGTSNTYAATVSGTYYVAVTISTCTATSASSIVTVTTGPSATITPQGSTTICNGDSVQLIASSATTYLWSNASTSQSLYAKTAGTYRVTVTDISGCTSSSATTTITVINGSTVSIQAIPSANGCAGDIIKLKSSSTSNNVWSVGATTQSINVTSSNNYTVTVTASNGCTSSASVTVSISNCDSTCSEPSNPRVINTYQYSAYIAWTGPPNTSDYWIIVSCPSSACDPMKTAFKGTQQEGSVKGLKPGTYYEFTVQTVCGSDVYSDFTTPVGFKTKKLCTTCAADPE